jgi:peptidyl-tRNA hydrolase, PTH1 family
MMLIAGLGNPGRLYLHSKHNVGFDVLDLLAKRNRMAFEHRKAKASLASGRIGDSDVVLAKPQTFMNQSGASVVPLLRSLHLTPHDLLVVVDDLDLPLGAMRLRSSGSAGGHHGLESIIGILGSNDFARLRIGIGRPGDSRSPDDVADYVLSNFTVGERSAMADSYTRAADAIEFLLANGLPAAMNRYNTR